MADPLTLDVEQPTALTDAITALIAARSTGDTERRDEARAQLEELLDPS